MKETKDIKRAITPHTVIDFWEYLNEEQVYSGYTDHLKGFGNCLYADSGLKPLVIRIYSTDSRDPRVAYLSVSDNRVQWRYGTKTQGFARCPIVKDPTLIHRLDHLFAIYGIQYFQHPLVLDGPEDDDYLFDDNGKGTDS